MIATISAIAEEKKVRGDHSDHNGNHLPAIVRWEKVLSQRSLSLRSLRSLESGFHNYDRYDRWTYFFFAIAAIIWKSGFNF